MPVKPQSLEDTVALLRPDRAAFAEFYDRERPQGAPDFKTLRLLRGGAAGPEADQTRQDILAALKRAEADGWLGAFSAAKARSLFKDAAGAIRFQAIANPNIDFDHIGAVSDGVLKAMVRCCRVVTGINDENPVKGSGFLIGPQLVLTNWHVVKGQIGQDAEATRGNAVNIEVEFDSLRDRDGSVGKRKKTYKMAPDWLVTFSDAHAKDVSTDEIGAPRSLPDDLQELAKHIDYAVIELAEPVGYERGWYDLSRAPDAPAGGVPGQLVQFPGNYAMRVTTGDYLDKPAYPGRIVHEMNTIGGSSGGLCASTSYDPIALHQGALVLKELPDDTEGKPMMMGVRNVAIPLKLIASMAGEAISLRARAAPMLLHQTRAPATDPIAGRAEAQRILHETAHGANRIMVVRNSYDPQTGQLRTGIGKSFTVRILEAMVEPSEHLIRVVGARDLPGEAFAAARVLAAAFREAGADAAVVAAFDAVEQAQPAGDTTGDAAIIPLAELLMTALRLAAGARTLWLVIDDLDRHPVDSGAGTANLLNLLYRSISGDDRVRAVLIGPTADLPGLGSLNARTEPLADLTEADIERWIVLSRGPERPLGDFLNVLRDMVVRTLPAWRADASMSRTQKIADILKIVVAPQLA